MRERKRERARKREDGIGRSGGREGREEKTFLVGFSYKKQHKYVDKNGNKVLYLTIYEYE